MVSRTPPPVARTIALTVLLCAAWPAAGEQAPAYSREDSRSLLEKVGRIERNGTAARPVPLRVTITERELNAYLAFDGRQQVPEGIVRPAIEILPARRVVARAVVDLDAVRREHTSTGWLDPVQLLTGQLPVSASGVMTSTGGVVRVDLESATVAGITIPKALLQEIVTFYTRTPENPRGVSLDDPYPLPARIKAIELDRAEAVIVQ